jgi:hypothetical protein
MVQGLAVVFERCEIVILSDRRLMDELRCQEAAAEPTGRVKPGAPEGSTHMRPGDRAWSCRVGSGWRRQAAPAEVDLPLVTGGRNFWITAGHGSCGNRL